MHLKVDSVLKLDLSSDMVTNSPLQSLPFGSSVACFEVNSIALGYRVADIALKSGPIHLLEASPMAPGISFLIFNGERDAITHCEKSITNEAMGAIRDSFLTNAANLKVFEALAALSKTQLEESLLIIETLTICSAIHFAHLALERHSLEIIDLRTSRAFHDRSLVFLTGPSSVIRKAGEEVRLSQTKSKSLRAVEWIENPHPDFKKYFQI